MSSYDYIVVSARVLYIDKLVPVVECQRDLSALPLVLELGEQRLLDDARALSP